ncbi:MAG: pentapeptide repeat-containing protein [Cyanobacterium sp. T60_A2020_053]|nr:pentapeptide repeat-containing protein [Cyanobacterium sp. T60_A2020_053]
MNKEEIIEKYQQGERDFTNLNLDGFCFRGDTLTGAGIGFFLGSKSIVFALSLAFISGITHFIVGIIVIIVSLAFACINLIFTPLFCLLFLSLSFFISFGIANFFAFAQLITFLTVFILIVISSLFTLLFTNKNTKNTYLLKLAKLISCFYGTKFCYGNLSNVNFIDSNLKNVDLRHTNYDLSHNINTENNKFILF